MGRSSSKKLNLKDGFYIEVTNRLGGSPIKLSRQTKAEILLLQRQHVKSKNVKYLGEFRDGVCVSDKL